MSSLAIDSEDSFDDDSFDEDALAKTLDQPSIADVTPKHATVVYEEIKKDNSLIDSSVTNIQKHINYDNIDTIIYPTNLETRDYQVDIVQKSLFQNVLCAIPTGLGKTFIASTVMLNYFRWTKEMKIIFMAPTKPLVAQQIKAFIQISGISMTYTDILLDRVKRNRKAIWDSKCILFATPQVVENDLKSGILDPNMIALLIIDEAHRARGNYAYTNVVKFLNRFNPSFRVLALTATPGLDLESIQSVVENLNISRIEIRTEKDPDIAKYIKAKTIDKLDCDPTNEILQITEYICEAIRPVLEKANESGIYDVTDPSKINHFLAMEKSQKIIKNPTIPEGLKWSYYFILQLLGTVGQFFRRLNIYGVKTFYAYFLEKYTEFTTKYNNKKSTNKLAAQFYYDENITKLKKYVESLITNDKRLAVTDKSHIEGLFSHLKFRYLVDELISFFGSDQKKNSSSSCIIFTEYRESALEIVRVLGSANKTLGGDRIRPHIFIGQSKEKDRFDQQSYLDKIKPKRKKTGSHEPEEKKKTASKGKKNGSQPVDGRPVDRIGSSENAQLKGMNQKVQKELIENFKSGEYNVLVATSIGEEGLDIGEVDLIICFDSTQSPIKNIQRMGRTGRKRDGKVLLLFSSNERQKFESSMGKYEWIQNQIKHDSNSLNYFDGSHNRIVPHEIDPILDRRFIEIPRENEDLLRDSDVVDTDEFLKLATQTIQSKNILGKKRKAKGKSRKKPEAQDQDDADLTFEKKFRVPVNAEMGFKPVSRMVVRKVVDVDGNEISTQSDANQSKSSNPLVLDSDDDYNTELLGNFANSSSSDKNTAKASASDLFMSIIDNPTHEASVDLTRDENPINGEKRCNTSGNEKSVATGIEIDQSMLNNISAIEEPDFHDEGVVNSEDDFSDISFAELEKNTVKEPAVSQISSESSESHSVRKANKRKFYDLSSDLFSDDIDDFELISQLSKVNEHPGPRPAKRIRN